MNLPNKAYMLPDAISNWPPVWWFWPLLALLILAVLCCAYLIRKRYKKSAYKRQAIGILKSEFAKKNPTEQVILCHELIKRCLLSTNNPELASLPMKALLPTLDEACKSQKFSELGDFFCSAPYNPKVETTQEQLETLYITTLHWIRSHHD
ncbi:DUF4381 domain-containing protein [Marinomonas balearica]|nr:DUF4381 domain-containing protein [Marinomonas balearica]